MPELDPIALQLDPGALTVSVLSLCVSVYAVVVARGSHSKIVKREEFSPFREQIGQARADLTRLRSDLRRMCEPTVPLEALVDAFDSTYAAIDVPIRAIREACEEMQRTGLFGSGWDTVGARAIETWADEFDCVQSAHRNEAERREAAVRAVAALDSFDHAVTDSITSLVRAHAR